MSDLFVDRCSGRGSRLGRHVVAVIVLASLAFTGVSVSVAAASELPERSSDPERDGPEALESAGGRGEYIVQLDRGADVDEVVADVAVDGVEVTGTLEGAIDGFTAPLDADALAALRDRDDVVRVERQKRYELTEVQDDPPWGLDRVDQRALPLDTAYTYPNSGAGVDVYVIDSGLRVTHSEFSGRAQPGAFIDYGDGTGVADCIGHGTHVAGTVGGTTYGVAKAVSIVPVKVVKCGETTLSTGDLLNGMNWVTGHHQLGQPAVANISLGGPDSDLIEVAVNAMVADGITVVVSAGNDPQDSSCHRSPANASHAITVSASDSTDRRAWFASTGPCIDVFAPGVDILSAGIDSDTSSRPDSGTSMAAPHVAGAAALILERNPWMKPAQVWTSMEFVSTKGVITERGGGDPDRLLHVTAVPDPPAEPTGLTAAAAPAEGVGSGQVKLTWTAPADGGSPITDYVIETSRGGPGWELVADGVSTATAATVGGLINGTAYSFRVTARTFVEGPVSDAVSATPLAVPDAPDWLIAIAWDAEEAGLFDVELAWASARSNGPVITDYFVEWSTGGGPWTRFDDGVSTATTTTVPGLAAGTTYSFRVAGVNALGGGLWRVRDTTTPAAAPAAPGGLVAAVAPAVGVGSGQVKLTWTAPAANGSPITDYKVERSVDGVNWSAVDDGVSTVTSATVGDLVNGTAYSFRVAAVNAVGTGPWSSVVTATPATLPGVATGLAAAVAPAAGVGSGQVRLAWTAAAANGSPVTDYKVERSVDGVNWSAVDDGVSSGTSATVGGLANGTAYSFRVAAVNAVGTGPWSGVVTATPVWTAAAPGGLTAAVAPAVGVGSGEVKLTWTAPAANGSPVTDYKVERSVDGVNWSAVDDGVSSGTSATVGGLANGTAYSFRVAAVNGLGTGPWSAIVTATPAAIPGVASGLVAAVAPAVGVGSGQVGLTWTAPAANGSPITDYVIQRSVDGVNWTAVDDGVSSGTSATVGGLVNGTAYSFRVAAVNAVGAGAWSGVVTATPVWTAAAPGGLVAAVAPAAGVGSGEVKLSWTAPAANGSPITDYRVERSAGGGPWTTVDDGVSAATSATVGGLVNGTAYSFRVAAMNALGAGPWSAVVSATPASAPGVAGGLVAAVAPAAGVGSGQVKLSWTAPAANGSPITDYRVERSVDGVNWSVVDDGVSTATSATVGGLVNGTAYSFRVAAVNAVGTGPWSQVVSTTPVWTAAAPGGLVAAVAPAAGVGSGQVKLTWAAPAANGSPITDYVIQRSINRTTWTTINDGVSPATSATVGGLANGTRYSFRVAAVNAVGTGPRSAIVTATPASAPGAAKGLVAAIAPSTGVGSGQVKLTWAAPAANGSAITDYVIQRSINRTTWTTINDGVSTARSRLVSGLSNGTRYSFRVAARNTVGQGAWSAPVAAVPRWRPGAPAGLRAVPASRRVTLTWHAPAQNGSAITDYVIQRSANGKRWGTVRDGISTARVSVVTRLSNGIRYRFRVAARNAAGLGPWSAVIGAKPGAR